MNWKIINIVHQQCEGRCFKTVPVAGILCYLNLKLLKYFMFVVKFQKQYRIMSFNAACILTLMSTVHDNRFYKILLMILTFCYWHRAIIVKT